MATIDAQGNFVGTGSIVPTMPISQTPVTPTPQPVSPTLPQVNPNTAFQTPGTMGGATAQQPSSPVTVNVGAPQTPQPQAQAKPQLAMPATGSVVDLLNMAGQDSSFAARKQLAQQYGIQGYAGTAAQNQELSKKYLEAYNNLKSTAVPESPADARNAITSYQDSQQQPTEDPIKKFMDSFSSMNPIEANLFQQLSTLASTVTSQQSLTDFYKQEIAVQGIPELNMQLADVKRIMDGTEDDIRDEITNAGGFATESQVQALTGARNKNLLKQATYLADVLNAKNDYVDRIVSLTQADRKQVSEDLDRKLGITETLVSMSQNMTRNAKENYQQIINTVGWGGLATALKGNATQTKKVEQLFGLAPGELQALGAYKKPLTAEEELRNKNLELQNKKLTQDINTGPALSTQVVDLGGKKVLVNSKTGQVIKEFSTNDSKSSTLQMANAQQTITDIGSLIKSPGLASTVGPNALARIPVISGFTGSGSNFIAGVEQLRGQLTLQNLQNAKANGATFGALSDSELSLLSSSASKLGTWAIKDKNGNVTGYGASESDFKKELDKINNFGKLDYILKGGSPTSVGVDQMPDGTLWTKNSDGTYTKIQ